MDMLIITLIGIATVYFMIKSRGFRIFVLVVIGVLGLSIYYWIDYEIKQSAARAEDAQAQAKIAAKERNERKNVVKTTDLLLKDVSLSPDFSRCAPIACTAKLEGVVTNNSKNTVGSLRFTVTISDCPERQGCRIVGQESVDTEPMKVPAGQTRTFSTLDMVFKNMPPSTMNIHAKWDYKLTEVSAASDPYAAFPHTPPWADYPGPDDPD
jgi:hypothetical protein